MNDGLKWTRYLNGNPVMLEIWANAINRIEANLPLAPVQRMIVDEWYARAKHRKRKLNEKAQKQMMRDEEYAEMAALILMMGKIENFVSRGVR